MNTSARFTKKPVTIEAIQFVGGKDNIAAINEFVQAPKSMTYFVTKNSGAQAWNAVRDPEWPKDIVAAVYDKLLNTWVGVRKNQWIIRGIKGELYPCDPDVFRDTYDVELEDVIEDEDTDEEAGTDYGSESIKDFNWELKTLLNRVSRENRSDTPDFLLANFLEESLKTFEGTVKHRDHWYGFDPFKRFEYKVERDQEGRITGFPPKTDDVPDAFTDELSSATREAASDSLAQDLASQTGVPKQRDAEGKYK